MTIDVEFEDFEFSTADGLILHARRYGWENDDPHPVVCLPSLTGNASEYDELARILSSKEGGKRRVCSLSARGRGRSQRDGNGKNYNLMTEASDVTTFITAAGMQDVNLIGTAHGGLTAMLLSSIRPGILKTVILNEAAPKIEGQELVRQKQFLVRQKTVADSRTAAEFLRSYCEPFFPSLDEPDWTAEVHKRYRQNKGKFVPDYDPAILTSLKNINLDVPLGDMWDEFRGLLNIPVMVIKGQHSDMISEETLKEMQKIKSDLVVTIAEGQGHPPLLHKGDLPSTIEAFLK